ncbi:hypothetical protein J5N97_024806 [Dioscorea zingiberensis]|uniref:Uncharacterized protein n=1 Tax=Dioscorea zingiberensis TaxID=325984 RepID=A0A9D5C844_9LILI|nr:hypothetical protein J5N97_024806 [Dioscorea zingiberensis]
MKFHPSVSTTLSKERWLQKEEGPRTFNVLSPLNYIISDTASEAIAAIGENHGSHQIPADHRSSPVSEAASNIDAVEAAPTSLALLSSPSFLPMLATITDAHNMEVFGLLQENLLREPMKYVGFSDPSDGSLRLSPSRSRLPLFEGAVSLLERLQFVSRGQRRRPLAMDAHHRPVTAHREAHRRYPFEADFQIWWRPEVLGPLPWVAGKPPLPASDEHHHVKYIIMERWKLCHRLIVEEALK